MRRLTAGFLTLLLVTLSATAIAAGEQERVQPRRFKAWTAEKTTTEHWGQNAVEAKEQPQWKQQLAAKARQKQEADKVLPKEQVSRTLQKQEADKVLPKKQAPKILQKQEADKALPKEQNLKSLAPKKRDKLKEKAKKQHSGKSKETKRGLAETQKRAWQEYSLNGIKTLTGKEVIHEAAKYKGVRYRFGGTTPKGFDCSGYVQYVFQKLHARLTRTADTQVREGVFVTQRQLKPGDLVFFSTYERGASHVGIYAGNGQFWNATSSRGVMLCRLQDDYWRQRYYGARRVLVTNGEPA